MNEKTAKTVKPLSVPTNAILNVPSPITVLKLSDNIEPNSKEIFFRAGTTASILYYLFSKGVKTSEASLKVLSLLKAESANPFKESSNPAGRVGRIYSRIRELIRLGGIVKSPDKIEPIISKEILAILNS